MFEIKLSKSELAEYAFPMPAEFEDNKKLQTNNEQSFSKKLSMMHSKEDRSKSSISKSFQHHTMSKEIHQRDDEYEDEKIQEEVYNTPN